MLPQTLRDFMSDKQNLKSEIETIYVFRSFSPKHGTQPKLSRLEQAAYGSFISGGRFNERGKFHVLYLSMDRDTCLAELDKYAERGDITLKKDSPHPLTLSPWEIKLSCVLDLTDANVRERLLIDEQTLCQTDWEKLQNFYEIVAPTQRIGELAKDFGFVALLTPSAARPGGKNINVLIGNITPGQDVCEICHLDEFPS
jgi:RES domain-containing protein